MNLIATLQRLGVPRGGILYVHSSMNWLERVGLGPAEVMEALRVMTADGTLVMPSYPVRGTHREYLLGRPSYDVRRTPVAVGLLPELLRRTPGAIRSLEPDYPVAAVGPDAAFVAGGRPDDDPFGPHSPYRRMLDAGATMIGMGVSLNTNSFIHVFDSTLEPLYPFRVYEERRISLSVTTEAGDVIEVPRRVLRPEFQLFTRPSAITAMIDDAAAFAETTLKSVQFFQWDLRRLEAWAIKHARTRLAEGQRPCWLEQLPDSLL
jgi:aminoglycoside N3'-acetyltransferase